MYHDKLVAAFDSCDQPAEIYKAAQASLASEPGFRLFTILVCDHEKRLTRRVYTSNPGSYPVGGTKPLGSSPWADRVLVGGDAHIGRTREDIKAAFFDYELIWSLGCESVINVPIRWRGKTLGTFNLLHEANYYTQRHEAAIRLIAQMCLPAVDLSIERISQ